MTRLLSQHLLHGDHGLLLERREQRPSRIPTPSFILHCYIRYWFTSSSLTGAASNDLKMYQDQLQESQQSCVRCLPPSTSETHLVPRRGVHPNALCNPALETETCNQLAREIGGLPPTSIQIRKPTLPSITSSSTLSDFVGPRSVPTTPSFLQNIGGRHYTSQH